jgi:sec-independent protein translocase protein TatA
MLGELSPWHLLILAAVVLVLFGAKKLPDSARSLGRAMRIFKSEVSGLQGDKPEDGQVQAQAQAAQPPQQLPTKDDGTLVNGVPISETQRTNQPG